jgi:hypothetical protein
MRPDGFAAQHLVARQLSAGGDVNPFADGLAAVRTAALPPPSWLAHSIIGAAVILAIGALGSLAGLVLARRKARREGTQWFVFRMRYRVSASPPRRLVARPLESVG